MSSVQQELRLRKTGLYKTCVRAVSTAEAVGTYLLTSSGTDSWSQRCSSSLKHQKKIAPVVILEENKTESGSTYQWEEWSAFCILQREHYQNLPHNYN